MEIDSQTKGSVIDITTSFDFTILEVRPTIIEKLYYFYNKEERCFSDIFILTDQPKIQRRCKLTLIEDKQKLIPRFQFFIWDKTNNTRITKDIIQDKPDEPLKIKARVDLEKDGSINLWALVGFLSTIKNIELKAFNSYKIFDSDSYISEFKTKQEHEKVEQLMRMDLTEETVKQFLANKRTYIIDIFRRLLEENNYIQTYKIDNKIHGLGEESAWHHFLKNNDWLLGLNVDIRFISDFMTEVNTGVQNTAGGGSPKTDLIGVSDYTVLVELKCANTEFFTEKKKITSRANTWSFTNDLIDGVSQCLGQKFDWDKNHTTKKLIDNDNTVLDQDKHRTVDPKTILIIGNKQKELPLESRDIDILRKRETLERFRRNNRNIEIISFDELYERSYFIVYNKISPKLNLSESQKEI